MANDTTIAPELLDQVLANCCCGLLADPDFPENAKPLRVSKTLTTDTRRAVPALTFSASCRHLCGYA
jgi:hypothetical protein